MINIIKVKLVRNNSYFLNIEIHISFNILYIIYTVFTYLHHFIYVIYLYILLINLYIYIFFNYHNQIYSLTKNIKKYINSII